MTDAYVLTREQMTNRLTETIQMFIEYRDVHGRDEVEAADAAVSETLDGLDADLELWRLDGEALHLQLDPTPTDVKPGASATSAKMGATEDS